LSTLHQTTIYAALAKINLHYLISCKLSFSTVNVKGPLFPTFALKSHNKLFMW